MSQIGSWSVKGIDDRARAVAKEKARMKGVTLGDYINDLLLQGHSEARPRDYYRDEPAPRETTPLDTIARRIEAVEARSTLAITGIDQSVLGLLARLENTETSTSAIAAEVEQMIDELRETQEALHGKVTAIEKDDRAQQSLEAMQALETALGKLASHVYEESALAQEETSAIKGRVESGFATLSDRVEGVEVKIESTLAEAAQRVEKAVEQAELRAEGTSRHLSERFSAIEANVATKLSKVDDMDARVHVIEDDVSGAITSMETTLARIQDRLSRAEGTTDAALKALESTFASLDERIEQVAVHANPERAEQLKQDLETRFERLAADLRASIETSRQHLADEIEQAAAGANPELMGRLEATVDTLKHELAKGEERSSRAIEAVGAQIGDLADTFDSRLSLLEAQDHTDVLHAVGDQISDLSSTLDQRVAESEKRSALAIEQVGEQVASAIKRVQARHEDSQNRMLERIDQSEHRQESRLSDALANISDRLAEVQNQSVAAFSPVQKAIASLAARLESVEDFTSPPHAGAARPALPDLEPPKPAPAPSLDRRPEPAAAAPQIERPVAADDDFIAGLPDFDEHVEITAETGGDEELGWHVDEDVDEDYTAAASPAGHDYVADIPPEPDTDDPLAELGAWEDGADEARESDIFADPTGFDDIHVEDDDLELASNTPASESLKTPKPEAPALLQADDDATNYLARARRAAIAAAADGAASSGKGKATKAKSTKASKTKAAVATAPKSGGGKKVPILAAASVFALAAAGAGGWVVLRGKQDVQASSGPEILTATEVAAASAPVAGSEPTLADIEYSETEDVTDDLDAELFEEEGSMAVAAGDSTPTAQVALNLPKIPAALSLERAASEGNAIAQFSWGEARLDAKDFAVGADFVRRAAQQGLPAAQYRLAKLHERGVGMPRDLTAAREWTEKAARGGNIKAMHDLAVFYADGEGGPQSYAAAAEWFRKAADFGVVDSQYNLAVLYENGLGISPSKTEALYWFEIAAANGDASAPGNVAALRETLVLEQAQQAQRRAASWTKAEAATTANGVFGPQDWDLGNREQVRAIQTVLNGLGYDAGAPDGLAGSGTRSAIRSFQADAGLAVTGSIDAALITALNERVDASS